jgi:uncharacterized membrane protein
MEFIGDLFLINYLIGNNTNSQQISNLRSKIDDVSIPMESRMFYRSKLQRLRNFHSSARLNILILVIVIIICVVMYTINKQTNKSVFWTVGAVGFVCMILHTIQNNQKRNKIREALTLKDLE